MIIRKTPEEIDADRRGRRGSSPAATRCCAPRRGRASRPPSSTRRPRSSSARRAPSRPSRATAASRARSAPRPTRWSCTASPAPTSSTRGDILSIDIGVMLDGWVADAAVTLPIGSVTPIATRLLATTREALFDAVEQCRPGNRLGDVSHAVQNRVEARRLLGDPLARRPRDRPRHARGPADPELRRARHRPGARGGHGLRRSSRWSTRATTTIRMGSDNWSVYSQDGSLAAHFEHTVAITAEGPRILTPWHLEEARTPSGERAALLGCYSFPVGAGPSPGLCAAFSSNVLRSAER